VFPPAVTTERKQYMQLIKMMPDHPEHMKKWNPGKLQNKTVALAKATYQLKPGAEIDTQSWGLLIDVVAEVIRNKKEPTALDQMGRELVHAWINGNLSKNKKNFFEMIYRHYQSMGRSLPEKANSITALLAYKEYVGDTCRDIIQAALDAYKKQSPDVYEQRMKEKWAEL
jgi:hypothetical protein